ncbi:MAG: MFS transporter [Eubacteriaceae bacterium]
MKQNKVFYGWYIVAGCFLILFAAFGIAYLSIGLYVNPICEEYQFLRGQFAITMSLIGIFIGAGSFFAGVIFKKFGIKPSMAIGGTLIALGLLVMSFSQRLIYFYIAGSIIGIGNALATNLPVCIIITNWFKEKKGFALGIALSASGFGGIAFSPVVAYIIDKYSYKISLLISSLY